MFKLGLFPKKYMPAYGSAYRSGEVLAVRMGEFDLLSPMVERRLGFRSIETHGLGSCVGLALIENAENRILLAHISFPRLGRLREFIFGEGFGPDTRAVVAYSQHFSAETMFSVRGLVLEITKNISVNYYANVASLGVALGGRVYTPLFVHERILPTIREAKAIFDDGSEMQFANQKFLDTPC